MTTTPYVRDSSGNKIYTNSLHHYKLDQRYIYTTFSENYDDENLKPGYLASFFKNNGLTHFESYCGMVLRLGILEKITMYEWVLFQENPNTLLSKHIKDTCLKDIVDYVSNYHSIYFFGTMPTPPQKYTSIIVANEAKFLKLRSEIYELTNTDLYGLIRRNYLTYENYSILKKSYNTAMNDESNWKHLP
jgi:hypothetical protein